MNIVFISNFFNHHQKYVSDALYQNCDSYWFIQTEAVPQERRLMGYYSDYSEPYLLNSNDERTSDVIHRADVVVIGSAPYSLIDPIKRDALIIRYSERPDKQKKNFIRYFYRYLRWRKQFCGIKRHYLLTSGAFAAYDYSKYGLFHNKMYRWGYFPQTMHYDVKALTDRKQRTELLWCGRLLDWKHPDDAISAAIMLRNAGYSFHLTMVGSGEMENELLRMVQENALEDYVFFAGNMPPQQVRHMMESSGIYLFTSDRQEGWGAVLNEAMNSACAVVASHACGSVPYLVKNQINALVYHATDVNSLYSNIRSLLDNPDEQVRLGSAAYKTITTEWNAEIAAERLILLSDRLLKDETAEDLFSAGPCSAAPIIKDDWIKEEL